MQIIYSSINKTNQNSIGALCYIPGIKSLNLCKSPLLINQAVIRNRIYMISMSRFNIFNIRIPCGHLQDITIILIIIECNFYYPAKRFNIFAKSLCKMINLVIYVQRLGYRSEEHTSELQSLRHLVCRLLLE